MTDDDNAASPSGAQPDDEPPSTAGQDVTAEPMGGQQHGLGGQPHGLGGQQHGLGGQQHRLGGQPHGPSGKRHGPGGGRHPTPFRFTRSGFIEYDRVLFFSDAVFAIAITLLAVDLRAHNDGHLDRTGLVGFGISFLVIALCWLGHHGIFRYIVALDRILIRINLLFLGIIALLPYPTALLEVAHGKHTAAVVFYAICVGAAGLGEFAIWQYATRPGSGLATSAASTVRLHYGLRIGRVPVVFLASIPVALAAPQDAPYIWIVIIVVGPVINRFSLSQMSRRSGTRSPLRAARAPTNSRAA